MKHDWRRGPVITFIGNTTYVCVRCGRPSQAPNDTSIEDYDPDVWYEHLLELNALMEDVDFDSECLGFADRGTLDLPAGLEDVPVKVELGGAIGRTASVACKQGQHDLCSGSVEVELGFYGKRTINCRCRCHDTDTLTLDVLRAAFKKMREDSLRPAPPVIIVIRGKAYEVPSPEWTAALKELEKEDPN